MLPVLSIAGNAVRPTGADVIFDFGGAEQCQAYTPLSFSPWLPTKGIRGASEAASEAGNPESTPARRVCTEDSLVLWLLGENILDTIYLYY